MDEKKYLMEGADSLGVSLSEEQADKLLQYKHIVLRENQFLNLTALKDDREFIDKNLIDSLSLLTCLSHTSAIRCIDVGTGAGFPGMVLKIMFPHWEIVFLDALNKRLKFIEKAAEELGIAVTTIHMRAEELGRMPEHRETYDLVVSRAVANLNVLLEYCIPLTKVAGQFIGMKGRKASEEITAAQNVPQQLGSKLSSQRSFTLPFGEDKRSIIIFDKQRTTSKVYPRSNKQIKNNPLV